MLVLRLPVENEIEIEGVSQALWEEREKESQALFVQYTHQDLETSF